jgi:hypothetical protein
MDAKVSGVLSRKVCKIVPKTGKINPISAPTRVYLTVREKFVNLFIRASTRIIQPILDEHRLCTPCHIV